MRLRLLCCRRKRKRAPPAWLTETPPQAAFLHPQTDSTATAQDSWRRFSVRFSSLVVQKPYKRRILWRAQPGRLPVDMRGRRPCGRRPPPCSVHNPALGPNLDVKFSSPLAPQRPSGNVAVVKKRICAHGNKMSTSGRALDSMMCHQALNKDKT